MKTKMDLRFAYPFRDKSNKKKYLCLLRYAAMLESEKENLHLQI